MKNRNRRHAFGTSRAVHARIHQLDCDLAVWIRRAPAAAKRYVRVCPSALLPDITFNVGPDDDVRPHVRAGSLWTDKHLAAFADDVAMLADLFRAETGAKNLRIRIERVVNDGCRLFHVDHLRIRLVTTYRGAGTEWLPETVLDRAGLKKGKNELIVRNPHGVRRMRPWAIALQKGELYSGVPDAGVIHRSPPVASSFEARLVVVIDDADIAYR